MRDLSKVMEREQLCSEHAAQCFLEAGRRMAKKKREAKKVGAGDTVIQACRPEDRAVIQTPEGAEMVKLAMEQLAETPNVK